MKDDRFIELINLYIDRQITAAETSELEAEIQQNPRRRAIYQQYCKMHRATILVHESFRAQAAILPHGQPAMPGTIAQFEGGRRQRRFRWTYYAGGLAAAACLGLIFGLLKSKPASEIDLMANTHAQALPVVTVASSTAVEPPAGLVSLRNNPADYPAYTGVFVAQQPHDDSRAFNAGRVQPENLPSLFEDGVFDSQQVMPVRNQRVFRGKQAPAQQAEFTAFQFQR